ncbi:hypothetical protein U9M48_011957 [Paspalum notatum var. saurae]|uniref:Uncharacterized protein n=1 Tax=Paspalum notatum var. saurae TaxID=547442 RepID=A0AAQ3SYZ1_PASNO
MSEDGTVRTRLEQRNCSFLSGRKGTLCVHFTGSKHPVGLKGKFSLAFSSPLRPLVLCPLPAMDAKA